MQLLGVVLDGHRSVHFVEFDAGPLTVLFGKNNAGKTNILEALYSLFTPNLGGAVRRTYMDRPSEAEGAVYVRLEPGLEFDMKVARAAAAGREPTRRIDRVLLTRSGLLVGSPDDYRDEPPAGWDDLCLPAPIPQVMSLNWEVRDITSRTERAIEELVTKTQVQWRGEWPWLRSLQGSDDQFLYRVPDEVLACIQQLSSLATDLLPDFVDGSIAAELVVPSLWGRMPKVGLCYRQNGATQCPDVIEAAGEGAARWMSAAIQIALHLMADYPGISSMQELGDRAFSGRILLIDEPEAHLHASAVASVVRWCHRMVGLGFNVVVASHHEEFLRSANEDQVLVRVTRDMTSSQTIASALPSNRSTRLLELAADIGMHPAAALSIRRAILFVEGPLDEALLDEYAGLELDAAGVKVISIHGTKNLEGLVAVELVTDLGIKSGILTDATDPLTMLERSNRKRSSEEKKLIRVIEIAREKGSPTPMIFGVPEEDLLFALPAEAIERYLQRPFPGWKELVAECRQALGKSPSDSVNWKAYAEERYGLRIASPGGVREVVRALDLQNVPLQSIRTVVDEIVEWARSTVE